MKKLLGLLLAMSLVFTLAACSSGEVEINCPAGTVEVNGACILEEVEEEAPVVEEEVVEEEVVEEVVEEVMPTDYANGFYSFKFADSDLRHTFMAAAENYLLETNSGGIPLYVSGSYALYSERLQLPVEEYVAVMGYGTNFATMALDDSHVLMDDGQPGNVGEYTFRDVTTTNPGSFNQWLSDSSTDSDMMQHFFDSPYYYAFNADKSGYSVEPSMAASYPEPVGGRVTDSGKTVSYVWTVTFRDDLEWAYNPGTDTTGFDDAITAEDFMFSYKTALENGWLRAIAGGGDFVKSTQAVVNAGEFADGLVDWSEVGIKQVDEYTLEFTFVNEQSEWDVKYWLSGDDKTPIHEDLYNQDPEAYGTSPETAAYHGAYYVTYYEADKMLRLDENPNYHSPNRYFFTGRTFQIIIDQEVRFQEFLDGKLEAIGLPTSKLEQFKSDPRLRVVPGSSTRRLVFNGYGTLEAQQAGMFPDSDYVPEPLLGNENFQKAMYFVINRERLATEIIRTVVPQNYHFSGAYLVDPESGIPYRNTEAGQTVAADLSPETYGYNYDAAVAYWKLAIDELVEAGVYEPGTEANPTIIDMTYVSTTGSETSQLLSEYIMTIFEFAFQDDEHHIKVEMEKIMTDFPRNYYDYMMTGKFDLADGGISGSTLDAAGFLDIYCDDNRGYFKLTWGVDTSTANIPVAYTLDGVERYEYWSFNAIVSALQGTAFVVNGQEGVTPTVSMENHSGEGFDVVIDLFDSPEFINMTYTIQQYIDGAYVDLEGYVGLPVESAEMSFDLGITEENPWADYKFIIEWTYAADETQTGSASDMKWL